MYFATVRCSDLLHALGVRLKDALRHVWKGGPRRGSILAGTTERDRAMTVSVEHFMDTLEAVGGRHGHALAQASLVFGEGAVRPLVADRLSEGTLGSVMGLLDGVAEAAPEVANLWLGLALKIRHEEDIDLSGRNWITSLPEGLVCQGPLCLADCRSLADLPDGLQAHGGLDLRGCVSLVRLPGRLATFGLRMEGCVAWDRSIPEDARIRGLFVDDEHPRGIIIRRQNPT